MEGQLLDMVKFPMFFEYMNGVVGSVYAVENDSIFCTNMKKGIISMFQVQTEEGERSEVLYNLWVIFYQHGYIHFSQVWVSYDKNPVRLEIRGR